MTDNKDNKSEKEGFFGPPPANLPRPGLQDDGDDEMNRPRLKAPKHPKDSDSKKSDLTFRDKRAILGSEKEHTIASNQNPAVSGPTFREKRTILEQDKQPSGGIHAADDVVPGAVGMAPVEGVFRSNRDASDHNRAPIPPPSVAVANAVLASDVEDVVQNLNLQLEQEALHNRRLQESLETANQRLAGIVPAEVINVGHNPSVENNLDDDKSKANKESVSAKTSSSFCKFGWGCTSRRLLILGVCSLLVIAGIVVGVQFGSKHNTQHTSVSTNSPSPPQPSAQDTTVPIIPFTQCQIEEGCEGIQRQPVTANGIQLKTAILEYLSDPSASPYGSNINCWDVSRVTNMAYAFSKLRDTHIEYSEDLDENLLAGIANEPINCWDVSKVTDMSWMFFGANAFNQDISAWDVSSVTDVSNMFRGAYVFNQDISAWDVSSVVGMSRMFSGAVAFNQDLSAWDVSSVFDMSYMFSGANAFNKDISAWDVSSVTDMPWMFSGADIFNQNLCAWKDHVDLSNVNTENMFFESACANTNDPASNNWCQAC